MIGLKMLNSLEKSILGARDFVVASINGQVREFAVKLRTTSGTLYTIAGHLRKDPIVSPVAPFVERAEHAVTRAATYLDGRGVSKIALDVEGFSRKRPIVATFVATILGFAVSRVVKASSVAGFGSTGPASE